MCQSTRFLTQSHSIEKQTKEIRKSSGGQEGSHSMFRRSRQYSLRRFSTPCGWQQTWYAYSSTLASWGLVNPKQSSKLWAKKPLNLPIKLVRARDRFLNNMKGLRDAEEKRKVFRDTFYSILGEAAKKEKCEILIQGTILPDIIETTKGIKTQHNILEQMKIDPVRVYGFQGCWTTSYIIQVSSKRSSENLGMPIDASMRQPFRAPDYRSELLEWYRQRNLKLREGNPDSRGQDQPRYVKTISRCYNRWCESRLLWSSPSRKWTTESSEQGRHNCESIPITRQSHWNKKGERQYGSILLVDATKTDGKCLKLSSETFDNVQRIVIGIDDSVSRVLYRISDLSRNGKWIVGVRV